MMFVNVKDNFSHYKSRVYHTTAKVLILKISIERLHTKWYLNNDFLQNQLTLCLLSRSSQHANACNDFYLV